jgi:hypothetical protein
MSDADRNNPSENEIEPPVDGPIPDWMRMATSTGSTPSLSEEDTPDWLKAIRSGKSSAEIEPQKAEEEDPYAGMSDLERLLAEEGIDLNVVPEERPEGAAGMSVRDWMITTSEDELIRKRVGAETTELEESDFEAAPMAENDMMVVEEDLPDWLRDVEGEAAAEPVLVSAGNEMAVVEEDLPDWLRDSEDEPAAAQFGQDEDLPDWLRDVEEEAAAPLEPAVAEDDKMVVEQDLPDWLQDGPEETLAEPAAASEPDNLVVEEDLPDWLRGLDEEPVAAPVALSADTLTPEEDLPDWLRGVQGEEPEPGLPGSTTALEGAGFEEDEEALAFGEEDRDLPDWLREVQAEADEEPALPAAPTALSQAAVDFSDADLPDWLRETQDEELKPEVAASARPPETDLPGWLKEAGEEEFEPELMDEDETSVVEEGLPEWLADAQPEVDDEPFEPSEPSPEEPARELEEDLPDWLRAVEAEEVPVEELPVQFAREDLAEPVSPGRSAAPCWQRRHFDSGRVGPARLAARS